MCNVTPVGLELDVLFGTTEFNFRWVQKRRAQTIWFIFNGGKPHTELWPPRMKFTELLYDWSFSWCTQIRLRISQRYSWCSGAQGKLWPNWVCLSLQLGDREIGRCLSVIVTLVEDLVLGNTTHRKWLGAAWHPRSRESDALSAFIALQSYAHNINIQLKMKILLHAYELDNQNKWPNITCLFHMCHLCPLLIYCWWQQMREG